MAQRLLNKIAVVTGASGALGSAVVERFLADGAKVVVFGRNRARLDELADLAAARVLVVEGDVTQQVDLESLVATTVRRFGRVDALVLGAEVFRSASLEDCTPEAVSEILAVNLQGALQTLRLFERHLNGNASIVFVTTAIGAGSCAGFGPFAASKAALASLARTLAVELSPRGIRVNCVAPVRANLSSDVARRDDATPGFEQAAEAALFLASDAAAGVTGQELVLAASTA